MSWDADLIDDRGREEGQWNYTHNCNGMIEAALTGEADDTRLPWWGELAAGRGDSRWGWRCWWDLLDGRSGPEGAALLDQIIKGLEADPERFRAMNPENGWGDYDSLVKVLTEMRNAVPEWPTKWSVHG